MDQTPYKELLAAFKRDCNETVLIASLLQHRFQKELVEPIVEIGAGSGELASLAFHDLTAILVDQEAYEAPVNQNHKRITCEFSDLDLEQLNPNTILLCHSANHLMRNDVRAFGEQLIRSGAKTALVVSNERQGILKDIAHRLRSSGVHFPDPFHIPLPGMKLERKVQFTARLAGSDLYTMAKHVVRIVLDLPNCSAESLVEQLLRSRTAQPEIDITEAIYCYRLTQGKANELS